MKGRTQAVMTIAGVLAWWAIAAPVPAADLPIDDRCDVVGTALTHLPDDGWTAAPTGALERVSGRQVASRLYVDPNLAPCEVARPVFIGVGTVDLAPTRADAGMDDHVVEPVRVERPVEAPMRAPARDEVVR